MITILMTILAFIIVFSILVLVHEYGHFITAKKSGVHVEEFGLGLPPRAMKIWKDKSGTIYSLNWIPFGGFVKMRGEDDFKGESQKDPNSFANKNIFARMLIVCAGVIMNFLLAIILLTIVFTAGFYPLSIVDDQKIPINSYIIQRESFAKEIGTLQVDANVQGLMIEKVETDSLAEKAGILAGDKILAVDGKMIDNTLALINASQEKAGQNMVLSIQRGEEVREINIQPEKNKTLGVYLKSQFQIKSLQFPLHIAFIKAVEETGRQSYMTLILAKNMIVDLFQKASLPEGVSGPVGIVQMTGTFVQLGIIPLMIFTSLLSISLAVLNIMPFPALDGGRLLFMIFELIFRKKPNAKVESTIHGIGYALLMLLIIIVSYNDIVRWISGN